MTIGLGHSSADQAEAMPLGDWRQQLHHIIMYCLLLPEYALMEELLTANPNQVRANLEALKKSRQPGVAEWAVPNATPWAISGVNANMSKRPTSLFTRYAPNINDDQSHGGITAHITQETGKMPTSQSLG
ncbi:hypothetical protein N7461_008040 [Penicillium sp. DV-2018c]|nr:hypothetical protein N7461_008040 [Penicillium sp. DV-2018c]